MGSLVFGTDGKRAMYIVVPAGGMRKRKTDGMMVMGDKGNGRTDADAKIEGNAMVSFSVEVVSPRRRTLPADCECWPVTPCFLQTIGAMPDPQRVRLPSLIIPHLSFIILLLILIARGSPVA